ncbi:hypothetical protein Q3G72_005134 [Acer saccharum]|nr:hypothetical protein Q3G72_005134 [Acer saccharum]
MWRLGFKFDGICGGNGGWVCGEFVAVRVRLGDNGVGFFDGGDGAGVGFNGSSNDIAGFGSGSGSGSEWWWSWRSILDLHKDARDVHEMDGGDSI